MLNKKCTCRWYVAYALCANLYLASDHFEFPLNEKEATKTFVFRGQRGKKKEPTFAKKNQRLTLPVKYLLVRHALP